MGQTRLPKEVEKFVERHLSAAAQAEALLFLHRERERSWTASAVGEQLRIETGHAEAVLASLAADGLLQRKGDAFRYGPRTSRLAAATHAFITAYPTYRVAIISLIFSKPRPSIRDFSEAFRIRSEDDDG